MAADAELTASEYIQHHLTFFAKPVGNGGVGCVASRGGTLRVVAVPPGVRFGAGSFVIVYLITHCQKQQAAGDG